MHNMAQAQTHSLLLGRRGAAEKVASFILEWAERYAGNSVVHLAMTRQDIADYLGLTIETVSRSLSQFERDGVIALPGTRQLKVPEYRGIGRFGRLTSPSPRGVLRPRPKKPRVHFIDAPQIALRRKPIIAKLDWDQRYRRGLQAESSQQRKKWIR